MKRRKGFTVVETTVAVILAMLTLVAVTAVITTASQTSKQTKKAQTAVHEAANIIACFQSDNYEAGLRFMYDDSTIVVGRKTVLYFDEQNQYLTPAFRNEAAWKIECDVTDHRAIDGTLLGQHMAVTASEIEGEEVIYEIEYTKAA